MKRAFIIIAAALSLGAAQVSARTKHHAPAGDIAGARRDSFATGFAGEWYRPASGAQIVRSFAVACSRRAGRGLSFQKAAGQEVQEAEWALPTFSW